MKLSGYKTIAFNGLKIVLAIAVHYGFNDFSADPNVDAFIANIASVCLLIEALVSIVLRLVTKTPVFKSE